ncbi:MAG: hypothetical protein KGL53_16825, partial [Elusimicrobia bacterium]|nr:hypothetical protein [Elusimicrobiota bacterium]
FAEGFERVTRAIADLGALFDREQVGQRAPAPPVHGGQMDDATVAAFQEVLARYNAVLDEVRTLGAYINAFVTTDSRDDVAQARRSEFQREMVPLAQLGTRFTAWIGALDVDGLLARSAHPFSTGLHPDDVRFTIRASGEGPVMQTLTALHECGHSLYEQNLDPRWWGTALGEYASLGLHESMSRLWENLVGKDEAFWRRRWPLLRRVYPAKLGRIPLSAVMSHLRVVRPGPVRLEADEVTYSLHILLRYELEKDLAAGRLKVRDIPEAWSAKSQELLGVRPPNDARGCLQDTHWASGLLGYFPTYVLGNLYGAQLYARFRGAHPRWPKQLAAGNLLPLKDWLTENVYRAGRRWRAADLVRRVTGRAPSAEPFLDHLRTRYLGSGTK